MFLRLDTPPGCQDPLLLPVPYDCWLPTHEEFIMESPSIVLYASESFGILAAATTPRMEIDVALDPPKREPPNFDSVRDDARDGA